MDKLRIFICSDQHEQWDNLNMVVDWFKTTNKGEKFDWVLLCGDQANCKNYAGEPIDAAQNEKANESNQRYIAALELFAKEPGHLLYIPGNHDSEAMF